MFQILERYSEDWLTTRAVFEELIPHLGGKDPEEIELEEISVTLIHLKGMNFFLLRDKDMKEKKSLV